LAAWPYEQAQPGFVPPFLNCFGAVRIVRVNQSQNSA
jgi:hypothetical protein